MNPNLPYGVLLRKLRIDVNLSAEDVAGLVGVTPRMISSWESGTQSMPRERLELLIMKLERRGPEDGLVTVLAADRTTVLDVVSGRNFAGCAQWNDGTATIKSLAIDRTTGRPVMHESTFHIDGNEHVIRAATRWQRDLMVGLHSEFEIAPDPAHIAMCEWLIKRVHTAEQSNPRLRELKDQIAMASRAFDAASTEDERKMRYGELDKAILALNREIH